MKRRRWPPVASGLPYLVIAFTIFLVFGQARDYEFLTWDERSLIVRNECLNPFDETGFVWIWRNAWDNVTAPFVPTMWGLLTVVTTDGPLPASAARASPEVFHLLQLTLHVATSWLVFATINHLLRKPVAALFGSLLFAIHPLQTAAVVWISQTSFTTAGFFSMGAILCFLLAVDATSQTDTLSAQRSFRPSKSRFFYVLATICYVAAVLSNTFAIGIPLVVAVLDIGLVRNSWKKAARWLWPWFVVSMAVIVMANLAAPEPAYRAEKLWLRPAVVLDIFAYRSLHLFVPVTCCPDYGYSFEEMLRHGTLYWSWFFGAVALVYAGTTRHRQVALTLVAVMILSALPRILFLPAASSHASLMADQFAYLWMLFPAMALAFWLATHTQLLIKLVGLVVILWLAQISYGRAPHFANDQSMLIYTLEKTPESSKGYRMVAQTLLQAKQFDAAIRHLNWALSAEPWNARVHMDLASVHMSQGDVEQSLTHLERALELEPHETDYANALAWCLATSADPSHRDGQRAVQLACEACEQTGWRKTGYIDTLAAAYAEAGDFDSAVRTAQMAIDRSRSEDDRAAYTRRLDLYRENKPYHLEGATNG